MIKSLYVKGLNQKFDFDMEFYPDLNIFTGKNGCGKTTLLKMLWYLSSGNLQQLFKEITFKYVKFSADTIDAELEIISKDDEIFVKGYYSSQGRNFKANVPVLIKDFDFERVHINIEKNEKSIFFPTFRRIEGGFSIEDNNELLIDRNGNQLFIGGRDDLNIG